MAGGERRGWVVPDAARFPYNDPAGTGVNTADRDLLVSDFPDVYLDVRPLIPVEAATQDFAVAPSSLFMQSATHFYSIVAGVSAAVQYEIWVAGEAAAQATEAAGGDANAQGLARAAAEAPLQATADAEMEGLGIIGTYADGSAWDGTLRFVWDDERRLYRTLAPVSCTLTNVVESTLGAAGVAVSTYDRDAGAAANHYPRLTIEFPVLETTTGFDGYCWFTSFTNEEAINYATATRGRVLSRQFAVEVIGVHQNIGPFTWVGMPAYRIPVGSRYAHPAPEILPEGLHYTHWERFKAFIETPAFNGFLTFQQKQQIAKVVYDAAFAAAGNNAAAAAVVQAATLAGPSVFNLLTRSRHVNGGMFYKRSGGVLSQLSAKHYDAEPNFDAAAYNQYEHAYNHPANVPGASLVTNGLVTTFLELIAANTNHAAASAAHVQATQARQAAVFANDDAAIAVADAAIAAALLAYTAAITPITYDADGSTIAANSVFQESNSYNLKGSVFFDFTLPAFTLDSLAPSTSDQFCAVPGTPIYWQRLQQDIGGGGAIEGFDFTGDPFRIGKVNGNDHDFVPQII